MHDAIEDGLGVVNIIHRTIDDPDWPDRRAAAGEVLDDLTRAAKSSGVIPDSVTASDIAMAAIRFCRPLGIGLDRTSERAVAHHQLDVWLTGLEAGAVEAPPEV